MLGGAIILVNMKLLNEVRHVYHLPLHSKTPQNFNQLKQQSFPLLTDLLYQQDSAVSAVLFHAVPAKASSLMAGGAMSKMVYSGYELWALGISLWDGGQIPRVRIPREPGGTCITFICTYLFILQGGTVGFQICITFHIVTPEGTSAQACPDSRYGKDASPYFLWREVLINHILRRA